MHSLNPRIAILLHKLIVEYFFPLSIAEIIFVNYYLVIVASAVINKRHILFWFLVNIWLSSCGWQVSQGARIVRSESYQFFDPRGHGNYCHCSSAKQVNRK